MGDKKMRLIITEFYEVEEYYIEHVHKIKCHCWKFINPHCILINNSVKIDYDEYVDLNIEEEYNITYNRQPGKYLEKQLEINERKQKEKKQREEDIRKEKEKEKQIKTEWLKIFNN